MINDKNEKPEANRVDVITSLAKGIVGALPVIGPITAEILGTVIPNQRFDRMKRFLEELEKRIKDIEQKKLKEKFQKEEFVDLLEDGFWMAARTLSKERLEYIASIIAEGIADEEQQYIKYKKLLSLLNALNDHEVLFLIMYGRLEYGDRDFMEKYPDILCPVSAIMGSSMEEYEKEQLQKSYKTKLVELELLRPRYKKPRKGEFPEIDEKTGMMKANGYELTPLGRMLLKLMNQKTHHDRK